MPNKRLFAAVKIALIFKLGFDFCGIYCYTFGCCFESVANIQVSISEQLFAHNAVTMIIVTMLHPTMVQRENPRGAHPLFWFVSPSNRLLLHPTTGNAESSQTKSKHRQGGGFGSGSGFENRYSENGVKYVTIHREWRCKDKTHDEII